MPDASRSQTALLDAPSPMATRSGLWVSATTEANATLDVFYDGYDQAFVLPNEKEEKAGFAECLALNAAGPLGDALRSRLGTFREVVLVARAEPYGAPVGGANFIAYPLESGRKVALNLNYIFVLPEQRRRGYLARLVEAVGEVARAACGAADDVETLIFIEQNDPLRMSEADYERDTGHSGLDQVARLAIWAKLGARIVDFSYVQPPLSDDQEADDSLLYSVLGARDGALDAGLLLAHLERFFSISVLKGRPLESSHAALEQVVNLRKAQTAGGRIALLDPGPALAHLRAAGVSAALESNASMRELARPGV